MLRLSQSWFAVLRSILANRFEPFEAVLSASAVIHGIWLLTAGWNILVLDITQTITTTPRLLEVLFAGVMTLTGLATGASMTFGWFKVRRHSNFVLFIMWLMSAFLAFGATGITGILWVAYLTIAVVSALVYLNVSVGVADGVE